MKLFKKKLAGFVGDNPNLRWPGFYRVKYKGRWILAKWEHYENKQENFSWNWKFANGDILFDDDELEDIDEKIVKEFNVV